MKKTLDKNNQSGFTIIELMIATTVFAFILIILTFGIVQITRSYYKGINQEKTQDTARTIINDVSQALEFNGQYSGLLTPASDGTKGFCVGNERFSFLLGKELNGPNTNPAADNATDVLVTDNNPTCSQPQAISSTLTATSRELMSSDMRLSNLSVSSAPGQAGIYQVTVTVAYGDNDLLQSPTSTLPSCIDQTGDQFCDVVTLTTTVGQRVE